MSAMKNPLDMNIRTMTAKEVTDELKACRDAGAWMAAERLSKHIARIELQLLLTRMELQDIARDLGYQSKPQEGDSDMAQRQLISQESNMLPPLQTGLHKERNLGWRRRARNWLLRLFRRPVIS